ncbi:MAG: hypothetical protein OSB70_13840 [Myxococcota bacterium]|nr:hypothetical protein [Myxococcota bacterium]
MSKKTRDRGQGPRKPEKRDEASGTAPALTAEDDLALSALLDGELDSAAAEKLRAQLIAQPALAERGAELGELSGHLQNLASPSERSEAAIQLEGERVDRMQAALRVRLAAASAESEAESRAVPGPPAPARVIPLRKIRREGWAAAAALAAGLLFYLAFGEGLGGGETSVPSSSRGEFVAAEPAAPHEEPVPEPALEWAASPPVLSEVAEVSEGALALGSNPPAPVFAPGEAESDAEGAEIYLAEAGQEELALALEWEVLSDFDVIENLELLELLDGLDRMERI